MLHRCCHAVSPAHISCLANQHVGTATPCRCEKVTASDMAQAATANVYVLMDTFALTEHFKVRASTRPCRAAQTRI